MSDLIISFSPAKELGESFVDLWEKKLEAIPVNGKQLPHEEYLHLAVTKRDEAGAYVGGFYGFGLQNWLNIHVLYVEPDLRHHGIGSEFVKAAEREVRQRDYAGMLVHTNTALSFYQKNGFTLLGQLPNRPRGATTYILTKELDS